MKWWETKWPEARWWEIKSRGQDDGRQSNRKQNADGKESAGRPDDGKESGGRQVEGNNFVGDKVAGDKVMGDKAVRNKMLGDKVVGDKIMMGDKVVGDKVPRFPGTRRGAAPPPGFQRLKPNSCWELLKNAQMFKANAKGWSCHAPQAGAALHWPQGDAIDWLQILKIANIQTWKRRTKTKSSELLQILYCNGCE